MLLLLLLTALLPSTLACTCAPRDFLGDYCTDNLNTPIVAVKLTSHPSYHPPKATLREKLRVARHAGRAQHSSSSRHAASSSSHSSSPPRPTTHSSSPTAPVTSTESTSFWGRKVYVNAEVVWVYRQGHAGNTRVGDTLTLSSTDGTCGVSYAFHKGREFILPVQGRTSGNSGTTVTVYMCDFILDRWYHQRVGDVDRFFKTVDCDRYHRGGPTVTPTTVTPTTVTPTTVTPTYSS